MCRDVELKGDAMVTLVKELESKHGPKWTVEDQERYIKAVKSDLAEILRDGVPLFNFRDSDRRFRHKQMMLHIQALQEEIIAWCDAG
jgi:hypothetical protein